MIHKGMAPFKNGLALLEKICVWFQADPPLKRRHNRDFVWNTTEMQLTPD